MYFYYCVLPKAANKRGAITSPAPGSESKMKKSGCTRLGDFLIELGNTLEQSVDQLYDYLHDRTFGFDYRPIRNGGLRLADGLNATLDPISRVTMVLVKEGPQLRGRNFLHFLQRWPIGQSSAHQLCVQVLKPVHHLRKIDFQVVGQAITLCGLFINQLASLLHQVLYPACDFVIGRPTAPLVAMVQ